MWLLPLQYNIDVSKYFVTLHNFLSMEIAMYLLKILFLVIFIIIADQKTYQGL